MYFTLADIGWYLYNLIERKITTFDKEKWFSNTIRNSIKYYSTKEFINEELKDILIDTLKLIKQKNQRPILLKEMTNENRYNWKI